MSFGATTIVYRFGNYLTKNKLRALDKRYLHAVRVDTMPLPMAKYETKIVRLRYGWQLYRLFAP